MSKGANGKALFYNARASHSRVTQGTYLYAASSSSATVLDIQTAIIVLSTCAPLVADFAEHIPFLGPSWNPRHPRHCPRPRSDARLTDSRSFHACSHVRAGH